MNMAKKKNSTDISYWNYRVVRADVAGNVGEQTISYDIHEVYYDTNNRITTWTRDAVSPYGESAGELKSDLYHFFRALRMPILELRVRDGKETLVEREHDFKINTGHYGEFMDRMYILIEHFDFAVASHPVVKNEPDIKKLMHEIMDRLHVLYQKSGELTVSMEDS